MGGTVSTGDCNDELVDNLILSNYISEREVERVFRAVDRGHYFPDDVEIADLAYRDVAWRAGLIHISAPCIYTEVLENLNLKPGHSFLNIGSGTGYLSTMAGLFLGENGVNIGIEIYPEVVEYATKRVRTFMATSDAIHEFQFCQPQFVCGNALLLPPGHRFDRIYCGAACNGESRLQFIQEQLTVGGLLIIPVRSELLLFKRESESEWTSKVLMPVAFTNLLPTSEPHLQVPDIPRPTAKTLEEISRNTVLAILRKKVLEENPNLIDENLRLSSKSRLSKKSKKRHSDDESDEEDEQVDESFDESDDCSESGRTAAYQRRRVKLDSGIVEDLDESDVDSMDWYESGDSDTDSDRQNMSKTTTVPTATKFARLLQDKILALGLPKPLLQYLNMGRVFKA